ncbi:glycoside hydrolase family 38 C-terminal domain-containing protein [Vibrio palustris]|uniref:Mannosylglycerate hydrolase n=1 Tax=Vibrio palustris TaxID=1918946 RepID=A0A1R4B3D2_9VIBR|nr:glycoside hydrolase family 38 C-terminal domain-containing protein [Vibrio palustris]SJL83415.1 Mannosylglycerate hydrolase [Vibrio palustris]
MKAKIVHLIPHTHWDYEWYFTHPESSVQLTYHMDDVFQALDQQQIQQYLLDGQTSIVEDYLQLAPENENRLRKLVTNGQIKIGPWYTQTDQLIISGESIVRNLLIGSNIADSLGASWDIGYVPDAFGQSIDMPKIYNGFGINHSVFWRGLSSDTCESREFVWTSEDGSKVNCYQIRNGYYLAEPQISGMDPDELVAQISEGTTADVIPFPYGADQIKVDFDVKSKIESYNSTTVVGHEFIESNYNSLFESLDNTFENAFVYQGEMIDAQYSKIHRSIYSTRYDHKQLNDRVETRLSYVLEPIMAIADYQNIPYKRDLLSHIWKTLLRCHAHDSAGGCNSDRTNRHIKQRLITVDEMSAANSDYLVRKLSESVLTYNERNLLLINTLPYVRSERVVLELDTLTSEFSIFDDAGVPLSFNVLNSEKIYHGSIRRTVEEQLEELYHYHHKIELEASLPSLGYRSFDIQEHSTSTGRASTNFKSEDRFINNERYLLLIDNGELVLKDTTSKKQAKQFIYIRDVGDDGDNYDYSPPIHDWELHFNFLNSVINTTKTSLSQSMLIQGSWLLPKDLEEREKHTTSAQVDFTLELTLSNGSSPLEIKLSVNNTAKDHRMQIVVDSDIESTESIADTPFGVVHRPNRHPKWQTWRAEKWKEEPTSIYPMIHYASIYDDYHCLTLFSNGIKEYEVINESNCATTSKIALTLFRSVGWLGKPDLARRPGIASGQQFKYIPTPDSQLLEPLTFDIAISLDEQYSAAQNMRLWKQFAVPVQSYQQQEINRFTNTMKYFGINPVTCDSNPTISLLTIDAPRLVYSALKHAQQSEDLIVRIFNPSSETVETAGHIDFSIPVEQIYLVGLSEKISEEITIDNGRLELGDFKPKQIKTFLVQRREL